MTCNKSFFESAREEREQYNCIETGSKQVKKHYSLKSKWGFLRETVALAKKAGIDKDTGLHRTGLEDYLKVIYPEIDDWIHDKS